MRNLLRSSSHRKPPGRGSRRSQAFSCTFTSFCSRKGTFDWPSLEVLPLSRLRKTGTPDDSPISWCPVVSCCKGNKTPKLLCIAYKGLSDPLPVTSPSSPLSSHPPSLGSNQAYFSQSLPQKPWTYCPPFSESSSPRTSPSSTHAQLPLIT